MDDKDNIALEAAPRYRQIHHRIRNEIVSGKFFSGELLPSENEICKQYNISRFTAQKAFQLLVDEGLIYRKQGVGTFVSGINKGNSTVELQLGGIYSADSILVQEQLRFAHLVGKMTGNQARVIVHHSSLMGTATEQLDKLCKGRQDMFGAATDWIEKIEPVYGITNLPFLFRSLAHIRAFSNSDVAKKMQEVLPERHGLRVLSDNWIRPPRVLLSTRPCFDLKDLKNLKIRVPSIQSYSQFWSELGAQPCQVPWGGIKEMLKSGTIQALDVPCDAVWLEGFHKIARYITHTRHLYSRACILISESVYQGLRSDIQKAIAKAAREAGESYSDALLENWEKDKEKILSDGARFITTDTNQFRSQIHYDTSINRGMKQYVDTILSM